jgi:hypothetical protein
MKTYHTRDGRQVDESTALDERGCIRDGYSIRSKATLMDSAQRDTFVQLTDQQKSDAIAARNAALSNAWRNPAPLADTQTITVVGDTDDVYERYNRRVSDAWRQTA